MTATPELTVIIPTHNPHAGRFARTLGGLAAQSLRHAAWETLVIDNASSTRIDLEAIATPKPVNLRILREDELGLTPARRRGLREARGQIVLFVDDDNVLASDYLERVIAHFGRHPTLGAAGGKSQPEFERAPESWEREFLPLLALRDLGPDILLSTATSAGASVTEYPECAPIGAGMALRREAWTAWLATPCSLSDRRGGELTSGGDNDLVMAIVRAGWQVGYFPDLVLTHLIPAGRLDRSYLERLNYGIQKTWMQVLAHHGVNPWPPIAPWSAPLRKAKAWVTHRAWSSPAAHIRWRGACGHFDGRSLTS